ncbi:MAG: hypothetical protein ACI9MC_000988 [Kiritimatiellia bacterium]|jgi:hypothetical protein
MSRALLLLTVLSLACSPEALNASDPGTSVGNPSKDRTLVTVNLAPAEGFEHTTATYPLEVVELFTCTRSIERWDVEDDLDLLAGPVLTDPPQGAWCTQVYQAAGNVIIEGEYQGTSYSFVIERPKVVLDGTWAVTEDDHYVLELGYLGWLNRFSTSLASGRQVHVDPDHPSHDAIRAAFERGAGLFLDLDADGVLSAEERERWMLARGSDRR